MKKTLPIAIIATYVLGLGSLTSCHDYEPYDSEVLVKTSFEENFKNTFGEISPNQTWDLTKIIPRTWKYDVDLSDITTRTAAGDQYTVGEADDILVNEEFRPDDVTSADANTEDSYWEGKGWYVVQQTTLSWMNAQLVEGTNNTSKGSPFTLHAPNNAFAIIPIYQGRAGLIWDLHLVDMTNNKDYKLWSKSEGIWRRSGSGTRRDPYVWSKPDQTYENGYTIGYNKVVGKPIIIDKDKVHGEFFLYLEIVGGNTSNYAALHEAQCSYEGMMLALHCPLPTGLDDFTGHQNSFAMIVGCEDANLDGSDWDMNDVVFLIVGYPNIPDVVEHYFKRYLCEDLGNTYDFDFNDIVVDVQQTSFINVEYDGSNNPVRVENMDKRRQTASIEHICGSLPFQVTVGDYTFHAVSDPTNQEQTEDELGDEGQGTLNASGPTGAPTRAALEGYDPEVTEHITGWNRETNNISIAVTGRGQSSVLAEATPFGTKVEEEDAEKHIYRIDFPDNGEVPLIIAVDRYVHWMGEHEHIPEAWWKEGKLYDPSQQADPLAWLSEHPLKYDTDGNPILEHSKKHLYAGRVNEIEDFHNQTSGQAHLIHAFNAGYNTVVMHFDAPVSGSYSLKTGEDTVLRSAVEYGPTTELLIYLDAVDINTIKYDDGLKIEITVNQNVNIRNITASQTTGN